ncbi:hypothetical protein HQN64_24340 [Enterobacteriaceae bacterium BIT-l23]|nr:hypothetical protein [Enterobacteriaceae bacterium BIT-l23]
MNETEHKRKSKQGWLLQLRRCTSRDTLEKVIEANHYKLTVAECVVFDVADHRLAEIIMNRLCDRGRWLSGCMSLAAGRTWFRCGDILGVRNITGITNMSSWSGRSR